MGALTKPITLCVFVMSSQSLNFQMIKQVFIVTVFPHSLGKQCSCVHVCEGALWIFLVNKQCLLLNKTNCVYP